MGYSWDLENNSLLFSNMDRKRQQTTFKKQHNCVWIIGPGILGKALYRAV